MAGTTTNNGWTYPTSTDYVKDGATAIQTLATGIDTSTGKGLIAWQAYTPTISGVTIGNATVTFVYCQIGKTVHVRGLCLMGSTSVVTGTLDVTLPVNSTGYSTTGQQPIGNVSFYNGSSYIYGTPVSVGNAGAFRIVSYNASGTYVTGTDVSTIVPFTWAPATGKFFACSFTYQAA